MAESNAAVADLNSIRPHCHAVGRSVDNIVVAVDVASHRLIDKHSFDKRHKLRMIIHRFKDIAQVHENPNKPQILL